MSPPLIGALVGLALAVLARRRARRGQLGLDDVALALALHLGLVGLGAIALAWAGVFSASSMALTCVGLALLSWPWRVRRVRAGGCARPTSLGHTALLLAVVALGVGLRLPSIPAPLAGRDQGTYVLRAQASVRTGAIGWTDELLARAGRERAKLEAAGGSTAGPEDLLGLYPPTRKAWRQGHYEASYRPGAYLGVREAGEVVPQFFHLHPMVLAVGGAAFGVERIGWVPPWTAGLWLVCLAACASRLWPRGPWAALAVALVACSPLAIWTGRTPLSEMPMAVFEWAAVLVALRIRAGLEDERGGWWLAGMLSFAAFVRGNALVILPVILALAWLRPRGTRDESAAALALLGLLASVIVHALTSYPYVHDELLRRIPNFGIGPLALITAGLAGALGWWVIDRELATLARPRAVAKLVAGLPRLLVLAGALGLVMWWSLKIHAESPRPFSRLDPLLVLIGRPLCGAAAIGGLILARRWRPRPAELWLVALASVIPTTILLYAPRQLPTLAFFYYGRYLVPELLPAISLLSTFAIATMVQAIAGEAGGRPRRVAAGLVGALASSALLWQVAGPLIRAPQLRLREYQPAGRATAWLARRLPPRAVVIAGGEGWHHGHTHNQVGGALAMGHGIEVLPYRTREDAWLSAWELLVARPERSGDAPPPVYLLVNEAAHHYTRDDGARVAMVDDLLWPPFVVERTSLLELFVHALTPVPDRLPTKVARHELRMALLRVAVDPEQLAELRRVRFEGGESAAAGVHVSGGLHEDGRTCLTPDRPLRIELPARADDRHLVIVAGGLAGSGLTRHVERWQVKVDGRTIGAPPARGLRARHRASLGPFAVPDPELLGLRVVEIRAAKVASRDRAVGECPWGHVEELRLLPRERGGLDGRSEQAIEAVSIAPARTLGHPVVPTRWVRGRSLTRHRPGTEPKPAVFAMSLLIEAGGSLRFAPIDLPLDERGRALPLDLRVTLTRIQTGPGARLRVLANGEELLSLEPPSGREGSWHAEPVVWQPRRGRASFEVVLEAEAGSVGLRDVAMFTRVEGIQSELRSY